MSRERGGGHRPDWLSLNGLTLAPISRGHSPEDPQDRQKVRSVEEHGGGPRVKLRRLRRC